MGSDLLPWTPYCFISELSFFSSTAQTREAPAEIKPLTSSLQTCTKIHFDCWVIQSVIFSNGGLNRVINLPSSSLLGIHNQLLQSFHGNSSLSLTFSYFISLMSNCMTNFTFPPVPHCKVKMIREKDKLCWLSIQMTNRKWA